MPQARERKKNLRGEIAAALRNFRGQFGFTQKQIADVLGIDRSGYSYMETGKTMPGIEVLRTLAQMYHTSIDELVGVKEPEKPRMDKGTFSLTKEEKTLLVYYRAAPADQKEEILLAVADICHK